MYQINFKPKALKQLRKLERKDQVRISIAIDQIAQTPFAGKKLDGDWEGFYTIRVWPYRIIYVIEKRIVTVTIVGIAHRKDVYR